MRRRATSAADARAAWQAHIARAAGDAGRHLSNVQPVADLNGDGRRDVVLVREGPAGVRYTAVAGSSGVPVGALVYPRAMRKAVKSDASSRNRAPEPGFH